MQAEIATGRVDPNRATINALLVDDSPVMLSTLARILKDVGTPIVIRTVTDGWLALRAALELTPELVLMDLHLPGLNGAETTKYLKLLPNPPIIFMITSDDTSNAQLMSKAAGADAFIVKASDLERKIRSHVREWFGDRSQS